MRGGVGLWGVMGGSKMHQIALSLVEKWTGLEKVLREYWIYIKYWYINWPTKGGTLILLWLKLFKTFLSEFIYELVVNWVASFATLIGTFITLAKWVHPPCAEIALIACLEWTRMINHLGNEMLDRKYEMRNTKTPQKFWYAIRFKYGPREGGVKIVVIAWNEFAKSCYNLQQTPIIITKKHQ